MVKKCVKNFLEPFEGKTLPQRWGKSEISRWSDQVENGIFRLPTFFSKVSKIFLIVHIAFIFSLRRVFIVILDPWKIWMAYDKTSGKYLGKTYPPPKSRFGGGLQVHYIFNQSLPDVSTDFFEINYCFQMVGTSFNILPNIITLHMPRSGRWRILVAHDFVGVENPPNTDWHTKSFSQSICKF